MTLSHPTAAEIDGLTFTGIRPIDPASVNPDERLIFAIDAPDEQHRFCWTFQSGIFWNFRLGDLIVTARSHPFRFERVTG